MKKLLPFILICLISFSLTACSSAKPAQTDHSKSDTKDSSEKAKKENFKNSSLAHKAVASTLQAPASVGEWVDTKRYSAIDHKYHTVYLKIKDIVRDPSEVDAVITSYNESEHVNKFPPVTQENLQYCLLKYEVMFPQNFPQSETGISFSDINFKIRTPDGEDYTTVDETPINLSAVYDISEPPKENELFSGDIYSDGLAVFMLPKNSGNYLIQNDYYLNQEAFSSYIKGY